ncbi:MAG: hypothetical protein ACR2NR_17120 [Solirubrobacteraceae bacterium]
MLGRSAVFVSTFSVIFILLELSAIAAGAFLFANRPLLDRVAGIAMGVLFVASVFVVRLNREFLASGLIERAGAGGPVIAGAVLLAFYSAGSPCPSCSPPSRSTPPAARSRCSNAITRPSRSARESYWSRWAISCSPASCSSSTSRPSDSSATSG